MKHKYIKHENCTHPHCPICEGGLAVCEICGCGEGELPTECPGFKCSSLLRDSIYRGKIDFKNGTWMKGAN